MYFDYPIEECNDHNLIKMTLLKHAQAIANGSGIFRSEDFRNNNQQSIFPDENLYDAIANTYSNLPAISVDFGGLIISERTDYVYDSLVAVEFKSKEPRVSVPFSEVSRSTVADIIHFHDVLNQNLLKLSKDNRLEMLSFDDKINDLIGKKKFFSLTLVQSTFVEHASGRPDGFTITYSVHINR